MLADGRALSALSIGIITVWARRFGRNFDWTALCPFHSVGKMISQNTPWALLYIWFIRTCESFFIFAHMGYMSRGYEVGVNLLLWDRYPLDVSRLYTLSSGFQDVNVFNLTNANESSLRDLLPPSWVALTCLSRVQLLTCTICARLKFCALRWG